MSEKPQPKPNRRARLIDHARTLGDPNWSLSVPAEAKELINALAEQVAISMPPPQVVIPEDKPKDPVAVMASTAKNNLSYRKEKLDHSLARLETRIDDLRRFPGSDGVNLMAAAAEAANEATLYHAALEHAETLAYLTGERAND